VKGEPIRKSPREFIIPIAVEGGGYVTPRAGSLEPSSDSVPSTPGIRSGRSMRFSRPFGRYMRYDRSTRNIIQFAHSHVSIPFSQLSESEGAETESTANSNGAAPSFSRMTSTNSELGDDELGPMGGTFGRGLHMHRLRFVPLSNF
jgi:hypothetical protein